MDTAKLGFLNIGRCCPNFNARLEIMSDAVSFQQINQILELTDGLEINREWVEIPLGAESPGIVRKLSNGKLEIIVDADEPFEEWLGALEAKIRDVFDVDE
jgi:hypothetical protein